MIQRIIINGLFHKFDYEIPLNARKGDSITFLTGCNGMGKTTILKMVEALLLAKFDFLFTVPFVRLQIQGEDYKIVATPISSEEQQMNETDGENADTFVGKEKNSEPHVRLLYSSENIEFEYEISRNDDMTSIQPLILFLTTHGCYHIKDSRMCISDSGNGENRVYGNSEWLKQELLNMKDMVMQSLIPFSVIRQSVEEKNVSDDFLIDLYWKLVGYEVFPLREKVILRKDYPEYDDVVQTMQRIYPVIRSNVKLNELIENLSIFESIIDAYSFIDKELEISTRYGFRFKCQSDKHLLDLEQLSSGEQQLVVQVFELIFRAAKESVVLIDEPEISLHPAWQIDYLSNLQRIVNVGNYQCIVATHQPMMFNNEFDKAVDLYTLAHPESY